MKQSSDDDTNVGQSTSPSETMATASKSLDLNVGQKSGTNDQDQSNNAKLHNTNNSNSNSNNNSGKNKTDNTNGSGVSTKSSKKHEKSKDHVTSTSHKCRCATTSKSSRTTVSMASGSGGGSGSGSSIVTPTNAAAVLRHLKDLPIREYEKLSPTPPISMVKPSSTNEQHSPKVSTKQNGENGHSTVDDNGGGGGGDGGGGGTDDALILRICSLNNKCRHLSSLSINRETTSSADKLRAKIKVRTKTDPHPITSSQKLHELSGSTHTVSKCNCSSCKSQSSGVSNADNHNKTKSVGTQHDANKAYDPWVRQNSKKDVKATATTATTATQKSTALTQKLHANSNAKVIVITDDFKKKALNQQVFIDTKRKMLRYMKANKLTNSSRSMDDDSNECGRSSSGGGGGGDGGEDAPAAAAAKLLDKQKTGISKSVDNLSQLSIELDQLDNVGSVELIFISDEFLNKVSKPDVIILNNSKEINAYTNRMSKQTNLSGKTNGSHSNSNPINSVSSENGQTSIAIVSAKKTTSSSASAAADRRCKVGTMKMALDTTASSKKPGNENGNGVAVDIDDDDDDNGDDGDGNASINGTTTSATSKHAKLNRQSSAETSIDDVNNKLTSHAFQSYDEQEHLEESKEIKSPTTEDIPT